MNELERSLQSAPLAAPSASLDRRMGDLFAAAHTPSRSRTAFPWAWLAGTAAFAAMLVLLLALPQGSLPPAPKTVAYQVEAQGRMRQLLLEPPAGPDSLPHFLLSSPTPD